MGTPNNRRGVRGMLELLNSAHESGPKIKINRLKSFNSHYYYSKNDQMQRILKASKKVELWCKIETADYKRKLTRAACLVSWAHQD